jgi:hypothetical protein
VRLPAALRYIERYVVTIVEGVRSTKKDSAFAEPWVVLGMGHYMATDFTGFTDFKAEHGFPNKKYIFGMVYLCLSQKICAIREIRGHITSLTPQRPGR